MGEGRSLKFEWGVERGESQGGSINLTSPLTLIGRSILLLSEDGGCGVVCGRRVGCS